MRRPVVRRHPRCVDLHPVSADDPSRVRALRDSLNEVAAADAPWRHPETDRSLDRELRHAFDGEPGRWFLVGDDAEDPDGYLAVHSSNYDNLEMAWLWFGLRPPRRRAGRGRAVLDLAFDVCREMGRPLVGIDGWEGPAARGFAAATGFDLKSVSVCRRLFPAELDPGRTDRLAAEAAAYAVDYELVRVDGRSPEELLEPLAALTESINDAPTDDLEFEDERYPVERIRAYEHAQLAGGQRLRRLVARHRPTGELAGHTVVVVDRERPQIGEQHDTSVARAHRGHRLGLLLKAEMVRWLAEEEPLLETVDTFNAESNAHMVAVNDALGCRIMARELAFQQRIPTGG